MEHDFIILNSKGKREDTTAKHSVFGKYILSNPGRAALAAAMIAPLRKSIDYHGLAQKVFLVDPLPSGALPVYDNRDDTKLNKVPDLNIDDIVHDNISIDSNGKLSNGRYKPSVIVPTFEIYNSPTLSLTEIKSNR
jgi:hypothetical protein